MKTITFKMIGCINNNHKERITKDIQKLEKKYKMNFMRFEFYKSVADKKRLKK